jgi:hypothetical protein
MREPRKPCAAERFRVQVQNLVDPWPGAVLDVADGVGLAGRHEGDLAGVPSGGAGVAARAGDGAGLRPCR